MQQDSTRFFRRYNRIVIFSFVGLFIVSLLLLFLLHNIETQKEKQRLFFELNERVDSLNSLLKASLNHLEFMKTQAENFMANPQTPKPKTAYSKALQAGKNGFLEIAKPPTGYKYEHIGNLTSLFPANNIPLKLQDEIEMALSLNPAFQAVQTNIPNMAWVYYTSKSKFINIYPWVSSSVFSLKEEVYTHEFYLDGLPERNPTRKAFWTPAYVDEAGKGLMVTVAAPVYDKDEFLGTVAIDLTVDFLNAFVSKLSAESGTILIFNEKEQLLAHPNLISSNDKDVKSLKEALPESLISEIPKLKNCSQLKFFSKGGYEIFVKHISNADWNILYFREKPPFFSFIFTPFGASFIILLLIVFGIFYVLNQLIVKDFIDPSQNLVRYIEQESVSEENLPLPIVPDAWRAWFEQVSEIFQQNRSLIRELQDLLLNLEKKVEERTLELKQANEKNENLLLNILPKKIVSELKTKGRVEPILVPSATILFTDFVNFSRYASTIKPEILVKELDAFFSVMDQITLKYGLEKLKTIGDSYMCAGGLPDENPTHTLSCCIAALEIIHLLKQGYEIKTGEHVWEIRIGIHTGPVVAGIIGEKKFAYDVWGDTVNIASRMESSGSAGKINVSYSVYEAMKDYFEFEPRGKLPIKGIGEVEMFFLTRLKKEFSCDESGFLPSQKFFAMYKEFSQKNEFSI